VIISQEDRNGQAQRVWRIFRRVIETDPSLAPVLELLTRARSRRRSILVATHGLFALAAVLLSVPPLLALASSQPSLARALGAILLLGGLAGFPVALWRARRELGTLQAAAGILAGKLDSRTLKRGLLPAVELGRDLAGQAPIEFSSALARAHIESVARAAMTADLAKALPDRSIRMGARALAGSTLVLLACAILFRAPVARGARRLFEGPRAAEHATAAEPVTGEIELTYVYPAYTRLPDRAVAATNGEISAPRGTQVTFRTRADRDVAAAFALVGESALPISVRNQRDLSGTLLVDKPGSWRFRFADHRGRILAEGPPIPIAVEEDAAPRVAIDAPAGEVGVDPKSRVTVRFRAEDDFGLTEVALAYQLPGAPKPERVILQRSPEAPRRASGDWAWDLSAAGLMAGDRVAYYLEAVDNDEVSGKKTGVSKTQYLKIDSEAERHRQMVKRAGELWEKLVQVLADRLEAPDRKAEGRTSEKILSQTGIDARAMETARELGGLARALRKEKAPLRLSTALAGISAVLTAKTSATAVSRSALAAWLKRGIGVSSDPSRRLYLALEEEIAEEERGVLYLETLLDQQRVEDLLALSKELAAKRRDLSSLLEKYRTSPDESTRDRLFAEIARLKERMAELMRRMSELSKGINDEHVNAEALKELSESEQMMSSFDRMQELLHQNKVEEAMKEMEKLGQMLDELDRKLQEASGKLDGGPLKGLSAQMIDFARSLDRVEQTEQELLEETQQIRGNSKRALEQRLAQKGPDFVKRLREKVGEARKKLEEISDLRAALYREEELKKAKQAAGELDQALEVKDFDQASQSVARSLGHLRMLVQEYERMVSDGTRYFSDRKQELADSQRNRNNAQSAAGRLQEVQKELGDLFPPVARTLSSEDRQRMKDLAGRQSSVQEETSSLKEKMEQMNQRAPLFSPQAQEMLRQAGERMGKAHGALQGQDPGGAAAEQRAALDQIGQIKKGLSSQKGSGGGSGAVPWPWLGSGQPSLGEGEGSEVAQDQEVQIPGADQYQVPEEYRKDILDAMKQSAPERYREQVKRYYEEIVR
jgi:hypothetical protein